MHPVAHWTFKLADPTKALPVGPEHFSAAERCLERGRSRIMILAPSFEHVPALHVPAMLFKNLQSNTIQIGF